MSVTGLERMTTGSAVSALSYRATQVDWLQYVFHVFLTTMEDIMALTISAMLMMYLLFSFGVL